MNFLKKYIWNLHQNDPTQIFPYFPSKIQDTNKDLSSSSDSMAKAPEFLKQLTRKAPLAMRR